MGSIFSLRRNSGHQFNKNERALIQIKSHMCIVDRYRRNLEKIVEKETEKAVDLYKEGKKSQALRCMKLKKYQCSVLEKVYESYSNLEKMVISIEFAQIEERVLNAISEGTKTLKDLQRVISFEAVDRIMGETEDAIVYQKEIDEAFKSVLTEEDEKEILVEFRRLEEANLPKLDNDLLIDEKVVPTRVFDEDIDIESAKVRLVQM